MSDGGCEHNLVVGMKEISGHQIRPSYFPKYVTPIYK